MIWNDIKEFPKGLEKDCYILVKHNSFMSDTHIEFQVFKYIKNENKIYLEGVKNGYVGDYEIEEQNLKTYYQSYLEITGCEYMLHPPLRIFK